MRDQTHKFTRTQLRASELVSAPAITELGLLTAVNSHKSDTLSNCPRRLQEADARRLSDRVRHLEAESEALRCTTACLTASAQACCMLLSEP